jgi:hypothetical protein
MPGQWKLEEVTMFDISATTMTTVNSSFNKAGYEFFGLKTYADVQAGNYTLQFQMRGSAAYGATGQGQVWKEALDGAGNPFVEVNGSGTTDSFGLYGTKSAHAPFVVLPDEARLRYTAATPTNTDVVQIVAFIGKPFGG